MKTAVGELADAISHKASNSTALAAVMEVRVETTYIDQPRTSGEKPICGGLHTIKSISQLSYATKAILTMLYYRVLRFLLFHLSTSLK